MKRLPWENPALGKSVTAGLILSIPFHMQKAAIAIVSTPAS
jgi:hypothetical protein